LADSHGLSTNKLKYDAYDDGSESQQSPLKQVQKSLRRESKKSKLFYNRFIPNNPTAPTLEK